MRPKPIVAKQDQESVWDYPRPPGIEQSDDSIEIHFKGVLIASTQRAIRILETSHPPTYYLPPEDIQMQYLQTASGSSLCEWKGKAAYFDLELAGITISHVAWSYQNPTARFQAITNFLAFYPSKVDCYLNGEHVQAQASGFYGGWITNKIVGPFKGEPGTRFW